MYKQKFEQAIKELKADNRYREFIEVARYANNYPLARCYKTGKDVVMWCSNDYLGQGQNEEVIEALYDAAKKYGVGAGGTRNISGNNHPLVELEKLVADFHHKEAGLVFASGYVANRTSIATIAKILDAVIFSDSCNHSSIIEGVKHSGVEKKIFKHNDAKDLEEKLKSVPISRPKLIVYESIYSMSGNIAPIKKFTTLAKKYNALSFVDEVHAVGLYGKGGRGIIARENLENEIDIIQGTLGKAFGLAGGYITASQDIIDVVRSYAPGFIFTTAMSPVMAAAAHKSIEYVRDHQELRESFFANVELLRKKLKQENIEYSNNPGHIIPIMIRDAKKCKEIADFLLSEYQIYIQPINFPTVPINTERLRITISPSHTEKMIDHLVKSLKIVLEKFEIL